MIRIDGLGSEVRRPLACVGVVGCGLLTMLAATSARSFVVRSGSMEPTLLSGDAVAVESIPRRTFPGESVSHTGGWPSRDEVWVYRSSYTPDELYIKRVVGIGGDTLEVRNNVLYVNGASGKIGNVCRDNATACVLAETWGPLVVPIGFYFLMGDNLCQSMDSRHSGPVSRDRLVGRVTRIRFSYDADTSKSPLGRIRWSRLGTRVD